MLAQQYDARDNKLHLNEIPIPEPKAHELLVKVSCATLCHSDVMLFEPNDQGLILGENPHTIGHEATGLVVQPGSGPVASQFKEGDPVGFICATECCFQCRQCKEVHNSWCETGKTQMQGFSQNGYFQEYVVVDAREAMVLPEGCTLTFDADLLGRMLTPVCSGSQKCRSSVLCWCHRFPRRRGLWTEAW